MANNVLNYAFVMKLPQKKTKERVQRASCWGSHEYLGSGTFGEDMKLHTLSPGISLHVGKMEVPTARILT